MPTRRNSRLLANNGPEIVTAANLKEAYRKVHRLYGDDAVISGTRTVVQRCENGLGTEKLVEVTVGVNRHVTQNRPASGRNIYEDTQIHKSTGTIVTDSVAEEIGHELDRIESLIDDITQRIQGAGKAPISEIGGSVGRTLRAAGVRDKTVTNLMQRFSSETGQDPSNRTELLAWLGKQIPAADCQWDGFFGCHAFVGYARAERQELVLQTSSRFRELDRNTLVLILFPEDDGIVRILQAQAAEHGFDAAIIRRPEQLQHCEEHFDKYEVVLLELPDLDSPEMAKGSKLHSWLAQNAGFHRHIVVPMDCDVDDLDGLSLEARHWNCDWMALTRTDRVSRQGKLLDIIEKVPLPVSLSASRAKNGQGPVIGNAGDLLDGILAAGSALEGKQEALPSHSTAGRGD